MDTIFNGIMTGFEFLTDAGPTVMLPIIITIIGMIFRLEIAKAFKSGLTLAIGFTGIRLVLNFMTDNIGPAAEAMVENTGVQLDVLDVGWGSIAAVTWASPIIAVLVFGILATNIIMLVLRRTNTLNVDIWNYHHMATVGVMTYFVTQNIFLGVASTIVMAIFTFKLADWSQPMVEDFFGIPGVTVPTVSALSTLVIAWPVNWLLNRIPFIRDSEFTLDSAQKYLGFFGDQTIIGMLLGFGFGFFAGYDLTSVLQLGVSMAAVLVFLPRMTSLFVEGLMPISDAAQKWSQEKFKGRNLFIGLDAAIVVGNQDVITIALVIIPITLLLALVLPGNRVMPFADLAVLTFRVAMVVALTRGNVLKSLITGTFVSITLLYAGTITAPVLTEVATSIGLDLGHGLITTLAGTSMIQSFLVFKAFAENPMIGVPILAVGYGIYWYFLEYKKKAVA
ncbi:MAG: PTS galactitol transporter subunit IIC [Atopostipes suicloacalis]|nr:PTS galactitol transporter subunit IIC [Atopostipes suicloacalis]